jgi:hypothetical protein
MLWAVQLKALSLISGRSKGFFSCPKHPHQLRDTPSLLVNQEWGTFPGVKWSQHKDDHSPLFSSQVMKEWKYTSTPATCIHGVYRDSLTFKFVSNVKE